MANSIKFKPFEEFLNSKDFIQIPFGKFAWTVVSLPLFSFIFCVIYSILYNFERATSSHCHVYNFLPSVSSVIGNFQLQRNVWQLAIALNAVPRFVIAYFYLKYHQEVLQSGLFCLSTLVYILNLTENVALIVLSFWTSSDNYTIHKIAFIIFICMSECYMLMICIMHKKFRSKPRNTAEVKSLKLKKRLLVVNISCILLSVYFFVRHNSFCEPYVYSAFAFFEYIVVLSNMAFHMTASLDFTNRLLVIGVNGIHMKQR